MPVSRPVEMPVVRVEPGPERRRVPVPGVRWHGRMPVLGWPGMLRRSTHRAPGTQAAPLLRSDRQAFDQALRFTEWGRRGCRLCGDGRCRVTGHLGCGGTLKIGAGGTTDESSSGQTSHKQGYGKSTSVAARLAIRLSVDHKNALRKVCERLDGRPDSFPAYGRRIESPPCRHRARLPAP